jgi:hypothetical protein
MAEEIESLSEDQIGALVRKLLGPVEEWDDYAAEFVLSVYGIDPGSSASYLRDLIFRDIDARRQRNEPIPPIVFRMLTSLIEKEETDTEATDADRYLKGKFGAGALAADSGEGRMLRAARRTKSTLSEGDKKILEDLELELARDVKSKERPK